MGGIQFQINVINTQQTCCWKIQYGTIVGKDFSWNEQKLIYVYCHHGDWEPICFLIYNLQTKLNNVTFHRNSSFLKKKGK